MSTTMKVDELTSNGNVRHELRLDDGFVASIKAYGVITPIVINKKGKVIDGHRRLAAAVKAGRDEVPVHVRDDGDERVAVQVVTNLHRNDLTPLEISQAAWDLKIDAGMNQKQVAAALGMQPKVVSELQKVGKALTDDSITDEQLATANQMTIEGLVDLAAVEEPVGDVLRVYAENADNWDNSIRSAAQSVRHEVEVAEFLDELSPMLKAWSDAGVEVSYSDPSLTDQVDQWGHRKRDRKYATLGGYDTKVDIDEHQKLECHVIQVYIPDAGGYSKPKVVHWCKDFKLHEAKGKSELKHENAAKKQETKEHNSTVAKEQREAKQARREQAAEWLRKGGGRKSDIQAAGVATLADAIHYDDRKKICVILGLDSEKPADVKGMEANSWFSKRFDQYVTDTAGDSPRQREMLIARLVLATRFVEQSYGTVADEAKELIDG